MDVCKNCRKEKIECAFIKHLEGGCPKFEGKSADCGNALLGEVREAMKEFDSYVDDDSVQITLYGNDGFDNQEKITGKTAKEIFKRECHLLFEEEN